MTQEFYSNLYHTGMCHLKTVFAYLLDKNGQQFQYALLILQLSFMRKQCMSPFLFHYLKSKVIAYMPNNKVEFSSPKHNSQDVKHFHIFAIRQHMKRKPQDKYPRFSTNNLQGKKKGEGTYRLKGTEEKYHPNLHVDLG